MDPHQEYRSQEDVTAGTSQNVSTVATKLALFLVSNPADDNFKSILFNDSILIWTDFL